MIYVEHKHWIEIKMGLSPPDKSRSNLPHGRAAFRLVQDNRTAGNRISSKPAIHVDQLREQGESACVEHMFRLMG